MCGGYCLSHKNCHAYAFDADKDCFIYGPGITATNTPTGWAFWSGSDGAVVQANGWTDRTCWVKISSASGRASPARTTTTTMATRATTWAQPTRTGAEMTIRTRTRTRAHTTTFVTRASTAPSVVTTVPRVRAGVSSTATPMVQPKPTQGPTTLVDDTAAATPAAKTAVHGATEPGQSNTTPARGTAPAPVAANTTDAAAGTLEGTDSDVLDQYDQQTDVNNSTDLFSKEAITAAVVVLLTLWAGALFLGIMTRRWGRHRQNRANNHAPVLDEGDIRIIAENLAARAAVAEAMVGAGEDGDVGHGGGAGGHGIPNGGREPQARVFNPIYAPPQQQHEQQQEQQHAGLHHANTTSTTCTAVGSLKCPACGILVRMPDANAMNSHLDAACAALGAGSTHAAIAQAHARAASTRNPTATATAITRLVAADSTTFMDVRPACGAGRLRCLEQGEVSNFAI